MRAAASLVSDITSFVRTKYKTLSEEHTVTQIKIRTEVVTRTISWCALVAASMKVKVCKAYETSLPS